MFILDTAAKWLKDDPDANSDIYQKKKQTNKQTKKTQKKLPSKFWLASFRQETL